MKRFSTIIITLLLFLSSAHAKTITLKDLVLEALKNNDVVKSSSWLQKEQIYSYKATKGLLFPKLWFEAQGMRSNNPPFVWMSKMSRADVGPDMMNLKGFNNPDAVTDFTSSVNLGYPLFHGFAIINAVKMKKLAAKSYTKLHELTKEKIALEVAKSYMEIGWLNSRVKAAQESVKSARYHLQQARARFKAGLALKSDVLKAKVYLTAAQERLLRERNALDIARRRLSILLGKSPTKVIPVNPTIEDIYATLSHYNYNLSQAVKMALKNRKDLQAQRFKVLMKDKEVKIAYADYLPQIDLISSFKWHGHNYPLQGEQSSWLVGGVLKLNIFDGLSRENRIKKAKAARLKEEFEYKMKEKETALEVISALKDVENARKRVELTKGSVEEALESLRIIERRYQQGLATITEVTDTQSYLEQIRSMYLGALYEYCLSVYRAEFAKGTLLKFLGIEGGRP